MNRIILHIDVNNAFLSWTAVYLLRHGYETDIRTIPAVIGGDEKQRNGIVLAKSPIAKKYGVVTAETLYSARKKCPNLKTYPPTYAFYTEMSNQLFNLLKAYSPDIEIASIDECYMDYGKVKDLYGDEVNFAYNLKNKIKHELGFTVNIGIANNKLCAKMASDFTKPDKVHTLYDFEIKDKMYPLPIGELFGIGKKTSEKLQKLGINTISDLANFDVNILYKFFKNQAIEMINKARGIDDSEVVYWEVDPKGIGNETTLSHDVSNIKEVDGLLLALAEHVGIRLRKQKKHACVVVVTIKNTSFKRYSHQRKLKNPTDVTNEIYKVALSIFNEMWNGEPIRLIGIRLDNLCEKVSHQVSLFDSIEEHENNSELDKIIDGLKDKYGRNIITTASLNNNDKFKKRLK